MGFISALCVKLPITIGGTVPTVLTYLYTVSLKVNLRPKNPWIFFESKLFDKLHDFFVQITR
jgi:hypothetical protein